MNISSGKVTNSVLNESGWHELLERDEMTEENRSRELEAPYIDSHLSLDQLLTPCRKLWSDRDVVSHQWTCECSVGCKRNQDVELTPRGIYGNQLMDDVTHDHDRASETGSLIEINATVPT